MGQVFVHRVPARDDVVPSRDTERGREERVKGWVERCVHCLLVGGVEWDWVYIHSVPYIYIYIYIYTDT